jgi:hypothetical protein
MLKKPPPVLPAEVFSAFKLRMCRVKAARWTAKKNKKVSSPAG